MRKITLTIEEIPPSILRFFEEERGQYITVENGREALCVYNPYLFIFFLLHIKVKIEGYKKYDPKRLAELNELQDITLYYQFRDLGFELGGPKMGSVNDFFDEFSRIKVLKNFTLNLTNEEISQIEKIKFIEFYRLGYLRGKESYEKVLQEELYPLNRSDENIKKITLELEEAIYELNQTRIISLTSTYFDQMGYNAGLLFTINRIIDSHYWRNSGDSENSEEYLTPIKVNTVGKKILLLDSLGVLDYLRKEFDVENNTRKLSVIVSSLLEDKQETIRKIIDAILKDDGTNRNSSNYKNNPWNSRDNREWLTDALAKMRINGKVNQQNLK